MSSPAMSPLLSVYERGTQAFILTGASSTNAQSGTAAPAGSNVFALAPSRANDQLPDKISVQVDIASGTASGWDVQLYGSLDGVNFYAIGSAISGTTAGSITTTSVIAVRYITASITTLTGTSPALNVSFSA